MMYQDFKKANYYGDKDVQVIELPYSSDITALVILPESNLEKYLVDIKDQTLWNYVNKLNRNRVQLFLPKFKINEEYKLKEQLTKMGMGITFTSEADFTKIDKNPMWIEDVIHKTYMEVDESGTEAAAVTAVVMTRKCKSIEEEEEIFTMNVNRPFIFCIRHKSIDQFMFIAVIQNID